jgi:hypothetical protein
MDSRRLEGDEVTVSPQVLSDMISLVANVTVPAAVIATWTPRERNEAAGWASAEHLSASDNAVKRLPLPLLVARAVDIASSPAVAQLAVEGWVLHKERLEYGSGEAVMDAPQVAQEAITGLLVLLGDEQRPATWQARARAILGAHPEGVTPADLMALLGGSGPARDELHQWLEAGWADGTLGHPRGSTWTLKR